jgi:acetyltransferase-like isoleucine patch superfamily enzyme
MKKYKLTKQTRKVGGCVLHRIKALRDFGNVKKGDLGGWIENEDNLSHVGDCWIYDDAVAYNNAKVCDNAAVYDNVIVCDNAMVFGNAKVYNYSRVYDNSRVYGYAKIYDCAEVGVCAEVYGHATAFDCATVCNHVVVRDYVEVGKRATVYGNTEIGGNAVIESTLDYIVFKNWWSSGRYFTWTRSNDMWTVGCFYGTGEELIKKAYADSEKKGREYERVVKYVESIKQELK